MEKKEIIDRVNELNKASEAYYNTRPLTYYYDKKYKKSYPRAYVQHPHLSSTLINKGG